jgi:hypothetical protein
LAVQGNRGERRLIEVCDKIEERRREAIDIDVAPMNWLDMNVFAHARHLLPALVDDGQSVTGAEVCSDEHLNATALCLRYLTLH